jgi:hypothetical protein
MDAVLSDLMETYNLSAATELLVSGDSAGGLATYWAIDHIASRLPSTRVTGAPDSGYFFYDPAYPAWGDELTWVVSYMNSTSSLNQACVAAQLAKGADPLQCAFPQVMAPYISTPIFVMNSRFDPALDSIVAGEGGGNVSNVNRIGATLLQLVNDTVLNRPGNAAFITSCHEHCGQWAQGQVLGPNGQFNDFNVTINGFQAIPALSTWYTAQLAARQESTLLDPVLWVQPALYPCATCCQGGQQ